MLSGPAAAGASALSLSVKAGMPARSMSPASGAVDHEANVPGTSVGAIELNGDPDCRSEVSEYEPTPGPPGVLTICCEPAVTRPPDGTRLPAPDSDHAWGWRIGQLPA